MTENAILAVVKSIGDAVALVDTGALDYVNKIVVQDLGEEIEPPAVVVAFPSLEFEGLCRPPTSAKVIVFVVVDKSERAAEQLYQLVPPICAAIDEYVVGAAVQSAEPGLFPVGSRDLPAYGIAVDIDL